jgi:hypothetical protein
MSEGVEGNVGGCREKQTPTRTPRAGEHRSARSSAGGRHRATNDLGVLTDRLPKLERAKPRQIEVKVETVK